MVPGLKNGIEVCPADMSWGGWMLLIVLHDEVWCFDIGDRLPRVVFSAEALPLDQELKPPLVPTTIQYLFHFPLFFSVDDNGWQWGLQLPSWYRIVWSDGQLDHVEHQMQLSQSVRQLESVG